MSRTISSVTLDPVTFENAYTRLKAAQLLKVVKDDRGNDVILLDGVAFEREPDKITLPGGAVIERQQVEDPVLLRDLCRRSWAAVLERDRSLESAHALILELATSLMESDDHEGGPLRKEDAELYGRLMAYRDRLVPPPKQVLKPGEVQYTATISPRKIVVGPEGGVLFTADAEKTPEVRPGSGFRLHLDDGKFDQPADGISITKPGAS